MRALSARGAAGWMLSLLLLATSTFAQERHLQLDDEAAGQRYLWLAADGALLIEGVADAKGQILVTPQSQRLNYQLYLGERRFEVTVPAPCWLSPETSEASIHSFSLCTMVKPYAPDPVAADWQAVRRARLDFSTGSRAANATQSVLAEGLAAHQRWLDTLTRQGGILHMQCRTLTAALAETPAQSSLPRSAMLDDNLQATTAYSDAAKAGNWRAAAGLFDAMLNKEDWELASVVVAWLLEHRIPAAYNKMASLLSASAGYYAAETGMANDSVDVIYLRGQAAELGDPLAQKQLITVLESDRIEIDGELEGQRSALIGRLQNCLSRQSHLP